MSVSINCPCGTQTPYEMCCGMYHSNPGTAPTAERLMRSRYTAFAIGNFDYIGLTQRLQDLQELDAKDSNGHTRWIKLEINGTEGGLENDDTGFVTFSADFKEGKHSGRLKERSKFRKVNQQWFYVSGEHVIEKNTPLINSATMNLGRNDPCLCGSGRKFKKCCAVS
ncbi:YchJ family protein [Marinomonas sp. IMCC 4694]|uniref:YchJ family protein n=1 Tax=Marinomonas sp. IMCC 4694 TaxID=2605432 RepID=UPI0011E7C7DB|nr:YchJ family protein [Marinomonas sp. IMCC 4694]TYL48037.1 YchJ family protein [Marinomonas sp. IMCC 4694]